MATNKRNLDWDTIRAEYEAGESQVKLSKKHSVSRAAIQKHIAAEHWTQDCEPMIQRRVAERVAGLVAGGSPEKKAEAIEAEAGRRANVQSRHRTEWDDHKELVVAAIVNQDFEMAKLAKITSETLKIRQEGERKAWGLDVPQQTSSSVTIIATPLDERI